MLSTGIGAMTMSVNTWRTVGLKICLTTYDFVLGRLLLPAGEANML
jgi:hypothetical protein